REASRLHALSLALPRIGGGECVWALLDWVARQSGSQRGCINPLPGPPPISVEGSFSETAARCLSRVRPRVAADTSRIGEGGFEIRAELVDARLHLGAALWIAGGGDLQPACGEVGIVRRFSFHDVGEAA